VLVGRSNDVVGHAVDVALEIADNEVPLAHGNPQAIHDLQRTDACRTPRLAIVPNRVTAMREPGPDLETEIERSAAPAAVRVALDQLLEHDPAMGERLSDDAMFRHVVVAVVAASQSCTRLLESDPEAVEVLTNLDRRVQPPPFTTTEELARWKRHEFVRVAARDLVGQARLETTGADLSQLARDVLDGAHRLAGGAGLSVIGMGKLGGNELNYASDVDIIFVGDNTSDDLDRSARQLMTIARSCFRVDANLRPEGRSGQLVRTIESYEAYWDRWAEPWEFQALLKARPAAGEAPLGNRFKDTAQRWLWNRPFSADDLRAVRALKVRSEEEVAKRGLSDRDVKRGRGGIRDIEFSLQILQLVHGHFDAGLRGANTLEMLGEMARAGYIDETDAEQLGEAYRFLRDVEHRVQLVNEQQIHVVPETPAALDHLARVLGFRDDKRSTASDQFDQELRQHMLSVRLIHERLYFRPLLEVFAGSDGSLTPEAAVARLEAFGFTDAKRTQAAVRELTRGLNRSSRLMQQLLPLLLNWLSVSPDPDLGLLLLRNVLTGRQRLDRMVEAFRESPEVARQLCWIFGSSRIVGDLLIRNPDVIPRLADVERLRTRPRPQLDQSARAATEWRDERDDRQQALRRWKDRHLIGIAARDLFDLAEATEVGADLTTLAEATLEAALESLDPRVPLCVIAMGRFGGAQLSYGSDLDVIFVYDGDRPSHFEEADRLGKDLLRFVNGPTPAERIYEIDANLRPEGKQGPMARSVDGFVSYFERWALVWERQAFIRARPVCGDIELGKRLIDSLASSVWGAGLTPEDVREIRRLKARIETERIPVGEDPAFHLKLGKGSLSDIEWTAQLLQLEHGVEATGTIAAIEELEKRAILDSDDARVLVDTYMFLEHTRNRLFLVHNAPSDSLPHRPEELTWLARSLNTTSHELREQYKRMTRRARRVTERLFYGKE
jgi:glutamate-ammonia-ligase adenylyltransferase